MTGWDWWVVLCFTFAAIGLGIVGWVTFHPQDATGMGLAAALSCLGYALAGLLLARTCPRWFCERLQ